MKCGDIFLFNTEKAKGHPTRLKFHLFVCEGDWSTDGSVFLFVSSENFYKDYRILNPPYVFLTKPDSFVACGNIVSYSDGELAKAGAQIVGRIADEHLAELADAIADSDTMEAGHIRLVVGAIRAHLSVS